VFFIHVRVGGHGPAVVMLHGFSTTGVMRGHLAITLIEDPMVVTPDLRGLIILDFGHWITEEQPQETTAMVVRLPASPLIRINSRRLVQQRRRI
jgi:hypothetical protein